MKDVEWRKRIKRKRQKYFVCIYFSKSHHTDLLQSFPDILALTFAILLTLTHVGVGGGGVSGLGAISSSGATSGLSANILSKSICPKDRGVLISTDQSYVTDQMCHSQKNKTLNMNYWPIDLIHNTHRQGSLSMIFIWSVTLYTTYVLFHVSNVPETVLTEEKSTIDRAPRTSARRWRQFS